MEIEKKSFSVLQNIIKGIHVASRKLFADYCKSMLLSLLSSIAVHWTKNKSRYWMLLEIKQTWSCWSLSAEDEGSLSG